MNSLKTIRTRHIEQSVRENREPPYLRLAATINLITAMIAACYMAVMFLQASAARAGLAFTVLVVSAVAYRLATSKYYPMSYHIPPYFITLVTLVSIVILRTDTQYPLLLMPVAFAFFVTGIKHGLILIAFQVVLIFSTYLLGDTLLQPSDFFNQMVVYFAMAAILLIIKLFQQARLDLAEEQSRIIVETERRQQSLRWQVEHEQANNQFIIGMSHDFCTPLTIIRNHAHLLSSADDPQMLKERQQTIDSAVMQITHLVDEMIALAQRAHESAPPAAATDATRTLQTLRDEFSDSRLQLGLDDPSLMVKIDPEALHILLTHLIDNALKFSPPDTPVTIRAQNHAATTRIEISDCGPGIPEDELSTVFTPFYKLDKSRNSAINSGAGLGLASVKAIVNRYDGHVAVQSEVDKGSTFTVMLPAVMQDAAAQAVPQYD